MQMDANIMEEIKMFLQAAGLGGLMAVTYDVIRLTRRILPRGLVWISIEDVCYWLCFGLIYWNMTYCHMDGELRIYVILSMILGAVIYCCTKNALKKRIKPITMKWKERFRKKGD